MAKYKVTPRQEQATKPKRSVGSIVVGLLPGVIGLGLVGLGLFVIVAVHSGGQSGDSRAGVGLIVVGIAAPRLLGVCKQKRWVQLLTSASRRRRTGPRPLGPWSSTSKIAAAGSHLVLS